MKIPAPLILFVMALSLLSCGPRNGVSVEQSVARNREVSKPQLSQLTSPEKDHRQAIGSDIPVSLNFPDSLQLDSVQIFLGGKLLHSLIAPAAVSESGPVEALIPTDQVQVGKTTLRVKVFFRGGTHENQSRQLTLLAQGPPAEYSYRIVREYPHDVKAYTQGLQYVDGWLYEGTGNYGTSSVRKVELETGKVLQVRDLDQSLFGEGITVLGQRIYQLTYKSQVGFIYDKHSFEELQKVYYQNREGWGLTHNGEELIMSDGTHVIYFLDPEMFTVNRQLQVYTDKGVADSLNELEFINGKIWANRYFTDEIVIIDPASGEVEGRINLKGILKAADRKPTTDVLNGIAWDEKEGRYFVTGKFWPKVFEIELRELVSGT